MNKNTKIRITFGNPDRWYKDLEGKVIQPNRFLKNGEAVLCAGKLSYVSGYIEGAIDLPDFEIIKPTIQVHINN